MLSTKDNKVLTGLTCVLQAAYGVISMFAAVLLNQVATTINVNIMVEQLLAVGLPAIGFAVVYGGSRAIASGMTEACAERRAASLRKRMTRAIFSMNSCDFSKKDTGEYLSLISNDVLLVRSRYYSQFPLLFCYVAQFILAAACSLTINYAVGLVLMGMSPIQYIVPALFGKKINKLISVQSDKTSLSIATVCR